MKKTPTDATVKTVRRASQVSTIGIIVILSFYLVITIYSTNRLNDQIKLTTEHPFTVSYNTGEAKTAIALMRVRTERLQSYNHPKDVEEVALELDDLYSNMDSLLKGIKDMYLGPDEDVKVLQDTYSQIYDNQHTLLEFAKHPENGTEDITAFEQKNLYELYETFNKAAEKIQGFTSTTLANVSNSADLLRKNTLLWSVIIFTVTIAGLIIFQTLLSRLIQTIANKNQQFDTLSSTIDETFLIYDRNSSQCSYVAENSERILGISSEELKKDRGKLYLYMPPEAKSEIYEHIYTKSPELPWETTVQYTHPLTKELRLLLVRFYLAKKNAQNRYIATITDQTEELKTHRALQDALAAAQHNSDAKRDFLSRMSHEIRTPMNAIIGMTTIAAASIENRAKVEDCLAKIGHSSKHLLMLINDILDMSRIESNKVILHTEPFDMHQFINTIVSVVYPQAQQKGISFQEKMFGFEEQWVFEGDSMRINQTLLNLTSNAIKFTPRGGEIVLEVRCSPAQNGYCKLQFIVSDTGIGMNDEELSRLYDPFEQANPEISQKYGGSGLGMSITLNLVTLMGGAIHVKSTPGKGTTFTVDLTLKQNKEIIENVTSEDLQFLKVLVVDDEPDQCEHVSVLLKKMNIRSDWVLSGSEAIQKITAAIKENDSFDVCLIDWKMPDMDGVETTRRIRETVSDDTLIIIISAYDWTEIEEEARMAGADAFISKPLFMSSLYSVLENATKGALSRAVSSTKTKHLLTGKKLLIAEDNSLNMEITTELLRMNGVTDVVCAANGRIAVDCFLQAKPGYFDAILMDVQMPVMDGFEATKQIRSSGRPDAGIIPIIATTANAFVEDEAAALAAGMSAHISKPINFDKLCELLSKSIK